LKKELIELRNQMKENGIDIYMIPTTDYHGSEYVNDFFKCRKFISGFSGSAGTVVVTEDEAYLWTDGRYFLQAAAQLEGTGIGLMKSGEPGYPSILEFLEEKAKGGAYCLGFDGRVVGGAEGKEIARALKRYGVTISCDKDLVGDIWMNRPDIKPSTVYQLPLSVTGKTVDEKLAELLNIMSENNADYLLMTSLEEIAWLFNLRGADIGNTPVFFAFALISRAEIKLFLLDGAITHEVADELSFVQIRPYMQIADCIKRLPYGMTLWIDSSKANYTLCNSVPSSVHVINKPTPVELMKAVKNDVEIQSTLNAHVKDGVAMVKFIYWLKQNIGKEEISEMSAASYLDRCRMSQESCFDLSFPTIAGYNSNGAIIHYDPTPETNAVLSPDGFLLVDSGGQYVDGTTDITRTIVLGHLNNKMKEYYTAVLKSHIALASAVFKEGTTGMELDVTARKPLRELGLDFKHGTGHGVGHILSVHEGPNFISPRNGDCPFLAGMITSDEPGVYIENEFGIRLENEILCVKQDDMLAFQPITYCPFDREAILADMLTPAERNWINDYHKSVYKTLSHLLDTDIKAWLKEQTAKI